MYNVSDLLIVNEDHPYQYTGLPRVNDDSGAFQVDNPRPFFSDWPMSDPSAVSSALSYLTQELVAIIQRTVSSQVDLAVEAWSAEGGRAAIEYLPPVLVVTQSAAGHRRIEELLEQYRKRLHDVTPLAVHAKWVQIESEKAEKFFAGRVAGGVHEVSDAALKDAAAGTVYQGYVRGFDGHVLHVVAGEFRSYVSHMQPVVGEGVFVCEPQMSSILIGAALEVRPVVSADGQSVTLDVHSFVTELKEMRSRPLPDIGQVQGAAQAIKLDLDVPSVLVHTFSTMAKVPLGKPVLIGGMTQPGAEKGKVLCLVLEVTAVK
jgi:hypothetical protein